jgi:hypothetical protein
MLEIATCQSARREKPSPGYRPDKPGGLLV